MLNILLAPAEYKGKREVILQKMIDTKYCVCCLNLVMDFSLLSLFDASFGYNCKRSSTRACTHTYPQARTSKRAKTFSYKAVNDLCVAQVDLKDYYFGSIRQRNLF